MKIEIPKEWSLAAAEREGNCEVGAGELAMAPRRLKIRTEEQLPGCWVAYDEDRYDGPGSKIGTSTSSEAEAIADLLEQLDDGSQPS